jgi:hypothetical protein
MLVLGIILIPIWHLELINPFTGTVRKILAKSAFSKPFDPLQLILTL